MIFDSGLIRTKGEALARQVAALPWRRDGGGMRRILLVTSRETRRWIVPKGWRIDGLTDAESAAREAYEEAGVEGRVDPAPIGGFSYVKRRARGADKPVAVDVYPLLVLRERTDWPERDERARGWFAAGHAATLVQEPELASLLRALD
jgi:8-oxo-dGTP pyrophosphatase MutT (NUDIX family)